MSAEKRARARGWCAVTVRWCAHAGERGSNALTIGQLSAAQAGAVCCTSCSTCTRLAAVRPRRCAAAELQLEREQPFGNGLRSDLERSSAEVTTKPDPDGRFVRRPQGRRTADLTTFARKGQICTYLRLDHVSYQQLERSRHRSTSPGSCCGRAEECCKCFGCKCQRIMEIRETNFWNAVW